MRRYGRVCLLLIAGAAAIWLSLPVFFTHIQTWFLSMRVADSHTLSATASNSLAYPVKTGQWLTFSIPAGSPQLRIITNAHIQPFEATSLAPRAYAVNYELLDNKGLVLVKGRYHQHSTLTTFKDAQGRLVYGNYYANQEVMPLDSRLILLGLQTMKGAAFIRVSLEALNPCITEAAVRISVPAKITEHQLATSWLRMNQEQRDNLAENSIYPASLLSGEERVNLLKHQWQPIGPLGINGKDYQTRTLYTLNNKEITPYNPDELIPAAGLQADAQHYGVVALPEGGGQLSLTLKGLDGAALTNPVAVNLQWFGRGKEHRWQHNTTWSKGVESLNYYLDGGLLMISPSSPVTIKAYITTPTESKLDITDALLSIKTYISSFGIDFEVLHYRQQSTLMRIDVRKLLMSATMPQQECVLFQQGADRQNTFGGNPNAAAEKSADDIAGSHLLSHASFQPTSDDSVRYQWLNNEQKIIASGELSALKQPSLFDRVGNLSEGNNVSDPSSYYFYLPAEVSRLRLISSNPTLLINAYNQPGNFIQRQRIPEDAYVPGDPNETQDQPIAWFPLRALNDAALMQKLAVQWISGQYRPPEDDPALLAGRYLWQDYIPQGNVAARYVLTDYIGDEPRNDALANVYCALAANQDELVKLDAFKGLRSVSPELIYLREDASPFSVDLFLNRQKVLTLDSMGKQGIIHLPETALGKQLLRLNTHSGGRWLMNYQAQCHGQRYLKRRVFALNTNAGLDFVVKHGAIDEVLAARWYSPVNTVDRSQITVDIEAITTSASTAAVLTTWTNRKRLYDIRPLPTKAMPVLYAQGQALSNGEFFVVPLNSDLPPGDYRLHISLAQGPSGYVLLSQTLPGVHDQRRFYQESTLETQ